MFQNYLIENLQSIKYLPGLVLVKNSNLEIIGLSDSFANFIGWKNAEQALGQTDYNMPCQASK